MKARLITFSLSHYCEKARWALDWHGIAFQEVGWPPGLHIPLARRAGAPRSSLPILLRGDEIIQGSDAIIDWTERQSTGKPSLTPAEDPAGALATERRADGVLGIHVRRLFYAEVLPHQAHLARPWLFRNASLSHRLVGTLMWPRVRKRMIQAMDAGEGAAADSRARVERELDWLDAILADRRRYLAGTAFSRVDLTVAALLAPFARPPEADVYPSMRLPPSLEHDVERWRERPVIEWVQRVYREHRRQPETRIERSA